MQKSGKVLGIDYGEKRIGLAISDPQRMVVFPREVVENTGKQELFQFLSEYCAKENVQEIVIGLPLNEDHSETRMTGVVREFVEEFKTNINIPIHLQDEKFTSLQAKNILESLSMDPQEQRKHKDVLAAMIILQEFLK